MIKQLRLLLGYTQEYIANELGITQKAYSDLENGKTCIKSETILKLARILNTDLSKICPVACSCTNKHKIAYENLLKYIEEQKIHIPTNLLKL